jgi:hypothetical protein
MRALSCLVGQKETNESFSLAWVIGKPQTQHEFVQVLTLSEGQNRAGVLRAAGDVDEMK